jgi:hypothetical protein
VQFLNQLLKGKYPTKSIASLPELDEPAVKNEGCSAQSEEGQCSAGSERKPFPKEEL